MKIAMLTTTGDRCGIAAYTRALVGGLRTLEGVEVEVVPITEGKQPTEHYIAQAERLNAPDVDVVHIQHEYSFWGSVLPRRWGYWELRYLLKKPVVLTAHTTYSLEDLLHVKTERRPHRLLAKKLLLRNQAYREGVEIAPFATAVTIVHTIAARNELIARGAKKEYVLVVPSGIPDPLPAPTEGQAFRRQHGLEARRIVTLFGYVVPNKGYELMLETLPALPEDVTFVIAGSARNADMEPYLLRLRETIARSGQGHRVLITGYLSEEEVAEAMTASDLVLVPHTHAGNSYSVTLPLTYGRPILASDLDVFREIWQRVECMELFQANNTADFRVKLLALLENPERRAKLAVNAKKYAARFSWPKVAALTKKVYDFAEEVYSKGHHPH